MICTKLIINAPALAKGTMSEAEVLGSVVWLLLQDSRYQQMPLSDLSRLILPPIKQQQYILAATLAQGQMQPRAFVSWANFDAATEEKYLRNAAQTFSHAERHSGDRMWILDWITPLGLVQEFATEVRHLLAKSCCRTLYHRGHDKGLRVMHMRGLQIKSSEAHAWWKQRPLPHNIPRSNFLTH
jgi:cytolysin-activating lysine-acyltransferase